MMAIVVMTADGKWTEVLRIAYHSKELVKSYPVPKFVHRYLSGSRSYKADNIFRPELPAEIHVIIETFANCT